MHKKPELEINTPPQHKKSRLFFYLFILTSFFILLEVSFFIQASSFYFSAFKLVAYHLKIPASVFPGIAYFLLMQIALHFFYALFIGCIALLIGAVLQRTQFQIETIGITLWIIGIIIILLANQYFYPDSKFTDLVSVIFSPAVGKIVLIILTTLFSIAILLALYGLLNQYRLLIAISSLIPIFLIAAHGKAFNAQSVASVAKPNIIIIGIDAVRPDFLGFSGGKKQTPHLDDFLNQSTVFSEAFTPLARTYPAWVSILTGVYPKKSGARFDLAEHIDFNLHETLPAILQRAGYYTIYATDETRFSNIDQRFGFNQIVTPPIGFNDFLLGSLNDFPLSNLVVNTWIGQYLLPYSYANRGAYITYQPATFLNLMQPVLSERHTKPVFLAVHFCLSHYPYLWAGRPKNASPLHNYQQALHQVDWQVYHLLKQLKQYNLLEHSVVILLSDHGEALELLGDRITESNLFVAGKNKTVPHFYPPSVSKEKINQSVGHGTDVLSVTQYHTLLAFKLTGVKPQSIRAIPGRVSLLDIKPTLLHLLNLPNDYSVTSPVSPLLFQRKLESSDGKSLLNFILGKQRRVATQSDFFIETDFTPEAVRSVNPETRKVLFEGIDYVQINPITTRVSIRPSMINLILSSKQYADFYGSWVLALYPQNKQWMTPVLVNLKNGKWTTDLDTAFAKRAPTQHMLLAMKNFYGQDIKRIRY